MTATTNKLIIKKEARTANSTYKKLAVQWLNEALCFVPILSRPEKSLQLWQTVLCFEISI
jgi:hypothetical protein